MIRLRYVTLLEYPSTCANRLQVIKMAEAFSLASDFELWVKSFPNDPKNIYEEYGVRTPIKIKQVGGRIGFWPKSFWAARDIAVLMEKERPDAVFYIRDVLLAFFLTFFSKRFCGSFVFEIHSLGKFPKFVYGRIFQHAHRIISTNGAKGDEIVKIWRTNQEKIFIAPNGVDLRIFEHLPSKEEARREFSLPLNKKIVMYSGSELPWKGASIIKILAEKNPDILFVKIGGRAEKMDNFKALPIMPYAKLPRALVAADALLVTLAPGMPQSEKWTSPLKIPTNMASGVPIVAPDTISVREILSEELAFIAKENTSGAFSAELHNVFMDENEARRRAANAREKVKEFDWRVRAEKILTFI